MGKDTLATTLEGSFTPKATNLLSQVSSKAALSSQSTGISLQGPALRCFDHCESAQWLLLWVYHLVKVGSYDFFVVVVKFILWVKFHFVTRKLFWLKSTSKKKKHLIDKIMVSPPFSQLSYRNVLPCANWDCAGWETMAFSCDWRGIKGFGFHAPL